MGSSPSLDAMHRSVSISGCCRQYDELCALSLAGTPLRRQANRLDHAAEALRQSMLRWPQAESAVHGASRSLYALYLNTQGTPGN
jgi:hypothetical protein